MSEIDIYNSIVLKIKQLEKAKKELKDAQKNFEKQFIKEMDYKSRCEKAVDFINKHCVNHKVSKEVGFKVYTMMVTDELEKVMKILENGRSDE